MARYFKIVEVSADEFESATDEMLDCCQLVVPTDDAVYVALDEESEEYIEVSLDCFDEIDPVDSNEYILEDVSVSKTGKAVSSGFYAGPNKKYADMFDRVPYAQYAERFQSGAKAVDVANRLNRAGYNFVVKRVNKYVE